MSQIVNTISCRNFENQLGGDSENSNHSGVGDADGFGLGAVSIRGLSAERKPPGAYYIVDVTDIKDPELYKRVGPKAGRLAAAAGGQYLARTGNIVGLHGPVSQQFVMIAFESVEAAKAYYTTPELTELAAIADKSATQRRFIV